MREDMERMLVGYLIHDPDIENRTPGQELKNAEAVEEGGIKSSWFEDKLLGEMFDMLMGIFKAKRQLFTAEELANARRVGGMDKEKAQQLQSLAKGCGAMVLARKIRAEILVKLVVTRRMVLKADEAFREMTRDCEREDVGPEKAIENFRRKVHDNLAPPGAGALKKSAWNNDFEPTMAWIKDMKRNPEKYKGHGCGIMAIDEKTGGFRPGHLTVFVGKPGGYKTTTLLNVAYGLWTKGRNVLYVSLEMDAMLLKAKLWARHAMVDYTELVSGAITEPEDFDELAALVAKDAAGAATDADRAKINVLSKRLEKLKGGKDATHMAILSAAKAQMIAAKNEIVIVSSNVSTKVKMSQVERMLRDSEGTFKPDVVIVDYLALCSAEDSRPDRRDLELGDVCKYLRSMGENMGFSAITAAQLRRAALERIKQYGESAPEKAALGLEDIAESHQIAADADTIFMLWPTGSGKLKVIIPKARHGQIDAEGKVLSVVDSIAMVSDDRNVEDMNKRAESTPVSVLKELQRRAGGGGPDSEDFLFGGVDNSARATGDDGLSATPPEDDF
jgi:replicative DNA helicase